MDLKQIIDRCKQNHRLSQQQLFERLYSYGFQMAMRYTHHREEADEVLSNTFLKVFTHIKKYDDALHFIPWFKKILIHTAIDYLRHKKLDIVTYEISTALEFADDSECEIDTSLEVLPLIQKLPVMYRTVFNLAVFEEYSHEEIGLMLGINASTSRSNLSRAKALLKKWLALESSQTSPPFLRKVKGE